MRVVTSEQMKEIERRAAQGGLSFLQMMENAGEAALREIVRALGAPERAVVFAGKGNNGGDGLVVARLLSRGGAQVTVVLVDGAPSTAECEENHRRALALPIRFAELEEAWEPARRAQLLVDALYGTGFRGALRERAFEAARIMNHSAAPVAALDLPSGVNADTGEAAAGAVEASLTVALDSLKPAHVRGELRRYFGRVVCAGIGIPPACRDGLGEELPSETKLL